MMEIITNSILTSTQEKKIYRIYNYNVIRNVLFGYKQDFINLGYIPISIDDKLLNNIDISERHWVGYLPMIYLYIKAFENVDFSNLNSSIEIGSGVGGGCLLIKKYFGIKESYGVDKNKLHILFSRYRNRGYDIKYRNFDSDNFYLLNKKFDFIYSIEASSHFKDLFNFFNNVKRCLNASGYFVYVDIFIASEIVNIIELISQCKLQIVYEEDISEGVILSIQSTSARKKITKSLTENITNIIQLNDGMEPNMDSDLYTKLNNKEFVYMKFIIRHET